MKKCISILLALCMLACPALFQAVAADGPAVRLSSCTGKAGDAMEVTLWVDGFAKVKDPDGAEAVQPIDQLFSAIQLKVYYDKDCFDVTEYGAADEAVGKASPIKLPGAYAVDIVKRSDHKGDYIYVSVMSTQGDGAELKDEMEIVALPLKAREDAPAGNYILTPEMVCLVTGLTGQPKDVGDQFALEEGQIRLTNGSHETETSNAAVPSDPADGKEPDDETDAGNADDNSQTDPGFISDTTADDAGKADSYDAAGIENSEKSQPSSAGDTGAGVEGAREEHGNNPKTGEIAFAAFVILAIGGAGVTVCVKKRRRP